MNNRRSIIILSLAMTVSILVNGYQHYQIDQWESAYLKQVGTTIEIEMIFKQASSDTSYENILAISKDLFEDSVEEVKADDIHIKFGSDEKAIKIVDAMLFFKSGKYYGSKVHLPHH